MEQDFHHPFIRQLRGVNTVLLTLYSGFVVLLASTEDIVGLWKEGSRISILVTGKFFIAVLEKKFQNRVC